MIEALSDINLWISLTTLTLLEIVLGIDNIIFITILSNKLKGDEVQKSQRYGLTLAMVFRIILVFGIAYIIGLTEPLFTILDKPIGIKDLILLAGGVFLIYQSVVEIHDKIDPDPEAKKSDGNGRQSLGNVLLQIALINVVFSFDSILTAIGLVEVNPEINLWTQPGLYVMISAIVLSMIFMMVFTNKVGTFIEERPTLKVLALSFLIMIGFMLIIEAFHIEVPKGYAYFAMAFAFGVELLNLRVRRNVPTV